MLVPAEFVPYDGGHGCLVLALAGAADRPAAVLTGPAIVAETSSGLIRLPRQAVIQAMARVELAHHPLTATAAFVWNGGLPRPLRQILFETAESIISSGPAQLTRLAR